MARVCGNRRTGFGLSMMRKFEFWSSDTPLFTFFFFFLFLVFFFYSVVACSEAFTMDGDGVLERGYHISPSFARFIPGFRLFSLLACLLSRGGTIRCSDGVCGQNLGAALSWIWSRGWWVVKVGGASQVWRAFNIASSTVRPIPAP